MDYHDCALRVVGLCWLRQPSHPQQTQVEQLLEQAYLQVDTAATGAIVKGRGPYLVSETLVVVKVWLSLKRRLCRGREAHGASSQACRNLQVCLVQRRAKPHPSICKASYRDMMAHFIGLSPGLCISMLASSNMAVSHALRVPALRFADSRLSQPGL